MNLKEEVLLKLDPLQFYQDEFPEWDGEQNSLVSCPMSDRHSDGDDSTPSLQINPLTGEFLCRGCGFKGTSPVGYYTDVHHSGNYKSAIQELYRKYVGNIISKEDWLKPHKLLLASDDILMEILSHRGWTEDTIKDLKLGWDPTLCRVTIPIFSSDGACIDMRYHDTIRKAPRKNGKRIPMLARKGGRTGDWFPLNPKVNPFDSKEIYVVEGEPDAILATQLGIPAVTLTGGAGAFGSLLYGRLRAFEGRGVVLCLDTDRAGQEAAQALSARLAGVDIKYLKNVVLPSGKDLTEYMLKYQGSVEKLHAICDSSPYILKPKDRIITKVTLHDSSSPEFMHKKVAVDVLVNGKSHAPIAIPKRITIKCNSPEKCHNCPCTDGIEGEHIVLKEDPEILKWMFSNDLAKTIKEERGLLSKCPVRANVEEWQSIEAVTMIPSLTDRESTNKYVARKGFFIGHGLESNQNYRAIATPSYHPRTKESVLLLYELTGSKDSIIDFELTPQEIERLRGVFNEETRPTEHIKRISDVLSRNVTRIYKRTDIHVGVDLCFHSIRNFNFMGTQIRRACLDIAIFGDTRCGKGQVAESLSSFYDLGSTISGENASFMGLVGGAQKSESGFSLVWGRIPTSDGRLLIIDECSGLQSMSQLSRVRSEGIAEIDKGGIHATTTANTRLIWIANPKNGRMLAYYPTGVQAFADFVGANEDIARYDLVIFAAKGEVSVEEINNLNHKTTRSEYASELLRKLVLWTWSRKSEDVSFTDGAVDRILHHSNRLSTLYSSSIPLIQGENIRFKIAKLAAAVAARVFASPDGKKLVVDIIHIDTAVSFMESCYNKVSAGYLIYSEQEAVTRKLKDVDKIKQLLGNMEESIRSIVIEGLSSCDMFGIRDLQDWTSMDHTICKRYIGILVRSYAIRKSYGAIDSYKVMPEFRKLSRKMK